MIFENSNGNVTQRYIIRNDRDILLDKGGSDILTRF